MTIKDLSKEIGSSGITRAGGFLAWDWVQELNGPRGAQSYREMAYTDALLHGMIFAVTMFLRRMEWRIEPADDTAKAKKIADECREMLFKRLRRTPWSSVIADASNFVIYGYCVLEKVWARDKETGKLVIDKIAYRAQTSLQRWEFDETETDELTGVWQQPYDRAMVFLPIEKLINIRTVQESSNPEGRSLLRGAYQYYIRKRVLEEGEGRRLLRSAGLVVGRAPMKWMGLSATQDERMLYASFKQAVNKIAEDRQAAVMLPSDLYETGAAAGTGAAKSVPMMDIEYKLVDARSTIDFNPTIERYDKRMGASVLADWLLLGQQGAGSWALSSDKTFMFAHALGGFGDIMEQEFQSSLIREWCDLNGYDEKLCPQLKHGDISERDLTELGTFINQMTEKGYLMPSPTLRQYIRETADLPKATEEELNAPVPVPGAPGQPGDPNDPNAQPGAKPGAPQMQPVPGAPSNGASQNGLKPKNRLEPDLFAVSPSYEDDEEED